MRGRILSAAVGVLTLVAAHPAAAQAPEPYRVGMTAAITGPFSAGYAPTYEAYRTYFKRVNEAGGINGHPVVITYEDDRGEPQRAAAAAKKLTDGALLLINASISPTYKPVMTEAEASKTPLLFGGGVCPREAFPPAAPLIFCTTSFGSKWDSRMALGFIKEQSGTKKVRVGFAAQDIPLSRIELEFAEQHARELEDEPPRALRGRGLGRRGGAGGRAAPVRLAVHAREAGAGAVERERRHPGAARRADRDDGGQPLSQGDLLQGLPLGRGQERHRLRRRLVEAGHQVDGPGPGDDAGRRESVRAARGRVRARLSRLPRAQSRAGRPAHPRRLFPVRDGRHLPRRAGARAAAGGGAERAHRRARLRRPHAPDGGPPGVRGGAGDGDARHPAARGHRPRLHRPHAPSAAEPRALEPAAAAGGRRGRVHVRPRDGRRRRRVLRGAVRVPEGLAARHPDARGGWARAARLAARHQLP